MILNNTPRPHVLQSLMIEDCTLVNSWVMVKRRCGRGRMAIAGDGVHDVNDRKGIQEDVLIPASLLRTLFLLASLSRQVTDRLGKSELYP